MKGALLWFLACGAVPHHEAAVSSAGRVDRSRLRDIVLRLQSSDAPTPDEPGSRVAGTPGAARGADIIVHELHREGFDVERRPIIVNQVFEPGRRVIAENIIVRLGTVPKTAPRLVVLAHHDARGAQNIRDAEALGWRWDESPSPGADDNASGSAALLEAARVIRNEARRLTTGVDLVFTGAEEMAEVDGRGFLTNIGAEAFAVDHAIRRSAIIGAISVDMLLRARSFGPSFRVYSDGRMGSQLLAGAFERAALLVEPGVELETYVDPTFTWSDHGSFWAHGWPAVLFIEDDFHHARYHKPTDYYAPGEAFYSMDHLFVGTRILVAAIVLLASGEANAF